MSTFCALLFGATTASPPPPAWWQWGKPPYALEVPPDLASLASPIWHNSSASANSTGECGTTAVGTDCSGNDLAKIDGAPGAMTAQHCCALCTAHPGCAIAVLAPNYQPGKSQCLLKSRCPHPTKNPGRVMVCPAGGGMACAAPVPQFVLARAEFFVPCDADPAGDARALQSAVVFVTAQQSPFCQPDARLAGNDYGSCIPSGGTSQAKLLGAYKLHLNGRVVAVGPGRRVNQTQGVDAIDVLPLLRCGHSGGGGGGGGTAPNNALALQGFHSNRFSGDAPRLLLLLRLTYADGSAAAAVATGRAADGWQTMDADGLFNPTSGTGAWAGTSGMPQEWIDMRRYPAGWTEPGFTAPALATWLPAAAAPPFALPLGNRPARPVAVYARRAASVTPVSAAACGGATGCFVIDYGRELQGGVNLTFGGGGGGGGGGEPTTIADGHPVTVLLSEELTKEGTPLVPMHTGNNFTARWTLRGSGGGAPPQTVMQHEYCEFRYAMVVNAPEPPTLETAWAWVLRYPLSDVAADDYGDAAALPPSPLRRPASLATFSSNSAELDAVWGLVRHTVVACGGLDVNVDSNTRQRDFCATDAAITGLGQLALSNDVGIVTMTVSNGFSVDSNIWQGMTDFRAALLDLAYHHALYSGDLSLVRARWEDIQKHSFVYYFDEALGLVRKTKAFMGSQACKCPESWSPAGLPPGIFEALHCTCTDLNDWPRQYQDGYVIGNVSTIANSYVALAARRVAQIGTWLGEHETAARYANVSATILRRLRERLYDGTTGSFADGLDAASADPAALAPIAHASMQATLFPMMAGVADGGEGGAPPGMGAAMLGFLNRTGVKCSCMAAFWLLRGLYRVGLTEAAAADRALELLTSDENFSWRNMLRQGATCTMETWPAGVAPGSGGTGGTWSHPWCAGPNSAIVRHLLGVQPLEPGWVRWSFMPQVSRLRAVNATVPVLVGGATPAEVTVRLTQSAAALAANFTVPAGTAARVCLPAPHAMAAAPGGAPALLLDGAPAAAEPEGRMLCLAQDVGPGAHSVARTALARPATGSPDEA